MHHSLNKSPNYGLLFIQIHIIGMKQTESGKFVYDSKACALFDSVDLGTAGWSLLRTVIAGLLS